MVVLVTGGSGFIGSHLVDKLIENGYDVLVFDKMKPHREGVKWYQGDLLNEKEVLDACVDVETLFHLGAIADVNVALSNPELCLRVNEVGTVNVLSAARAKEVDRIILASTTWVYGKAVGTVNENTPILPPDHIYTMTKIGQEYLVITWQKHYGLAYTILRCDIPYGPRMRLNMAIAVFVHKALKREPLTVFGDGNQGRCFIYVEDLAEGHVKAIKPSGKNQIFNIAEEKFVTINQIVENLRKHFGQIKVEYADTRREDFKGVKVSIEKAKKLLGWRPRTPFEKGLEKYIKHIKTSKP